MSIIIIKAIRKINNKRCWSFLGYTYNIYMIGTYLNINIYRIGYTGERIRNFYFNIEIWWGITLRKKNGFLNLFLYWQKRITIKFNHCIRALIIENLQNRPLEYSSQFFPWTILPRYNYFPLQFLLSTILRIFIYFFP